MTKRRREKWVYFVWKEMHKKRGNDREKKIIKESGRAAVKTGTLAQGR